MSSHKICFVLDLTKTIDVLNDYFGTSVPDEYLLDQVIMKSGQLLGEAFDNTISDTYARDMLIERLVKSLPGGEEKYWPMYSTDKETSENFYKWYSDAIKKIGGTFQED